MKIRDLKTAWNARLLINANFNLNRKRYICIFVKSAEVFDIELIFVLGLLCQLQEY